MLIRIVKMTFTSENIPVFKALFERQKDKIRAAEGCRKLELLQNRENPAVFMTYSWWESEVYLEKYRMSELFKTTWAETRILFAEKPEAWSMEQLIKLD